MYGEFNSLLSNMKTTYPGMRFMKVHDAANLVLDWRAARYIHKSKNGSYQVLNRNKLATAKQSWFLYAKKQNESAIEYDLVARKYSFHKSREYRVTERDEGDAWGRCERGQTQTVCNDER